MDCARFTPEASILFRKAVGSAEPTRASIRFGAAFGMAIATAELKPKSKAAMAEMPIDVVLCDILDPFVRLADDRPQPPFKAPPLRVAKADVLPRQLAWQAIVSDSFADP